jgi:hypothetical protein
MYVKNQCGVLIDFEVAVKLMDDEIRELTHEEGHDSEQAFFDAYCQNHLEAYGEEFELNTQNPVY